MNRRELQARLERDGWSDASLGEAVREALRDEEGGFDPGGWVTIAEVAQERAEAGASKDAAALAVAALASEPGSIDEEDFTGREAQRWGRYRLRASLRDLPLSKKLLSALPKGERLAVEAPEIPLTAKDLSRLDEPEQLAARAAELVPSDDLEVTLDSLAVVAQVARPHVEGHPEAAAALAGSALEATEKARVGSDAARGAVEAASAELQRVLVRALAAMDDDAPGRRKALTWLLKSKGGEPRVGHRGFPVAELSPRDQAEVVARLQKKAPKSKGARRALLYVGQGVLPQDEYLELCREQGYAYGVVTVLLERGDAEQAARDARAAILEDDEQWTLAQLFAAAGRVDLAIDMLREAARKTVRSDLELWLAERLDEAGLAEEATAVHRRRFEKRPGMPQYVTLRERVDEGAWQAMRRELLEQLRARRLHRPLVDIATDENDLSLLSAIVPELDDEQAQYAEACLRSRLQGEGGSAELASALAELEERNQTPDHSPAEVTAAAPVPERVRHKKFGEGKVVGWSGEGEGRKLEIEFAEAGRKVLLERFVEVC